MKCVLVGWPGGCVGSNQECVSSVRFDAAMSACVCASTMFNYITDLLLLEAVCVCMNSNKRYCINY